MRQHPDPGAVFDNTLKVDASGIAPLVSRGTSPDQSVPIDGHVPQFSNQSTPKANAALKRALDYMGLTARQSMQDIPPLKVVVRCVWP